MAVFACIPGLPSRAIQVLTDGLFDNACDGDEIVIFA
jgi:hypothetical protein